MLAAAAALAMPMPGAAAPLRVAVALNPMSLPWFVAQREGHFAAEGLDVRVLDCVSGARCLAQVLDGSADVATAADTPIMLRSFERDDFAVIATFAATAEQKVGQALQPDFGDAAARGLAVRSSIGVAYVDGQGPTPAAKRGGRGTYAMFRWQASPPLRIAS